jgi:hypothetical protein
MVEEEKDMTELADRMKELRRGRDARLKAVPPPVPVKQDRTIQSTRQLERRRPDLLALVERGEMSMNAALIEAGLRHRYARMRTDDPVLAMCEVLRHYPVHVVLDALDVILESTPEVPDTPADLID